MLQETLTEAYRNIRCASEQSLCWFLFRGAGTWKSINLLYDATEADTAWGKAISNDCGALLRTLWDTFIQAGYVFADPAERDARGELYLNYLAVEKHMQSLAVVALNTKFSQQIASSPLRVEGEKDNQREFDKVKHKYESNPKASGKTTIRKHWYRGDLRSLSKAIGCENEYISFVVSLNGSTHAGPSAIKYGCPIRGESTWVFAAMLVCRIARMVVDNGALSVSSDANEIINAFQQDPLQF